jgi:RND family efflux transporter MFP subunit
MKRLVTITLLTLAALTLLLGACGKKPAAAPDAGKAAAGDLPRVRTGDVTEVVADEKLAVTGSIKAKSDVNIASKIAGRVTSIGAEEGDRVAAGKVLVQLDARQAAADVARLAGAFASAKASYNKAVYSVSLVDTQTDTAIKTAEAQVSAARARQAQAAESLKIAGTKSGDKGVDVTTARDNLTNAQSKLTQMQQALLINQQKTTSDVDSSQAAVEQAASALQEARTRQQQADTNLALTDSTTQTAVTTATQAVNQAQLNVSQLEEGSREQERGQAKSAVIGAQSALRTAQADFARAKQLFDAGAVSKASLDAAQLTLDTRTDQLKQAELNQSLVEEGPRHQQVDIGRSQLAQAKEQLDEAKTNRTQSMDLRRQDVSAAKDEVSRADQALKAANANLLSAKAARGQVQISEADVAQAEQTVDSTKQALRLAEAGMGQEEIAKKELEAAVQAVAQTEQGLLNARAGTVQHKITREDVANLKGAMDQAQSALRIAQVTLSDNTIFAPFPGAVGSKSVEVGAVVSPGQTLYTLVGDAYLYFEALVPEEKVRFVNSGDPVDVTADALPGRTFVGHVMEVLPSADVRSRSFTVRVGVDNKSGVVKEGMFARGSIVTERDKHILRVPIPALRQLAGRSVVMRLDHGDTAVPTDVVIGASKDGLAEITAGKIMPGDKVVTEGGMDITGETKVNVVGVSDKPAADTPTGGTVAAPSASPPPGAAAPPAEKAATKGP